MRQHRHCAAHYQDATESSAARTGSVLCSSEGRPALPREVVVFIDREPFAAGMAFRGLLMGHFLSVLSQPWRLFADARG